ncbi:Ger(x)C family spore germination protein [Priestia megaterium]|uniref:Ger(x)C family spore germination protein n=1 Tax=Priestia megaterium TaxID=1404 RepID=UPI0012B8D2FA|nr:Ger(x)C family spore germination protein [Priestia megaterium]
MKPTNTIISLIFLLSLTGCWGMKEIQHQIYVTAIGLDFKKNKYYVHFQAMSFSNVAMQEGGSSSEEPPILIGTGKGDTLEEAFDNIQKSSPSPLYFGHISTLFFTPSMLKHHLNEFLDYAGRTEVIRYNTGIFSITKDMKEAMSLNGFFGRSPAFSFTFNPGEVLENDSFVPTITYQNLIQRYEQPVGSILIPSLKVDEKQWKEGEKPKPIVEVSGGYLLAHKKIKGWLSKKELEGINWFNKKTIHLYLVDKSRKVGVKVKNPRLNINVLKHRPIPEYEITVKVPVTIQENTKNISQEKLKNVVKTLVKKQINKTFQKGVELDADALNLSEKTYRFNRYEWNLQELNELTPSSIKAIEINVILEKTSAYK